MDIYSPSEAFLDGSNIICPFVLAVDKSLTKFVELFLEKEVLEEKEFEKLAEISTNDKALSYLLSCAANLIVFKMIMGEEYDRIKANVIGLIDCGADLFESFDNQEVAMACLVDFYDKYDLAVVIEKEEERMGKIFLRNITDGNPLARSRGLKMLSSVLMWSFIDDEVDTSRKMQGFAVRLIDAGVDYNQLEDEEEIRQVEAILEYEKRSGEIVFDVPGNRVASPSTNDQTIDVIVR